MWDAAKAKAIAVLASTMFRMRRELLCLLLESMMSRPVLLIWLTLVLSEIGVSFKCACACSAASGCVCPTLAMMHNAYLWIDPS